MLRIIFLLLIALYACNDPKPSKTQEEYEKAQEKNRQLDEDAKKAVDHGRWETDMKVQLYKQGFSPQEAQRQVDSIAVNEIFKNDPPAWYLKYKRIRDSINAK